MALEIEDGTGKATADSYVSADDLNSFCTDFGYVSIPADKADGYLRRAALDMNAMRWTGDKTSDGQALAWPRSCVVQRGAGCGAIPDNLIPREIRYGQIQLALELYGIDTTPQFDAGASGRVTSITESIAGAVTRSKTYDNTGRVMPVSPHAKSGTLFADFLVYGGLTAFVARA